MNINCSIKDLPNELIEHCINTLFKNNDKAYISYDISFSMKDTSINIIELVLKQNNNIYTKSQFCSLFNIMKKNNISFAGSYWRIRNKLRKNIDPDKKFIFGINNNYSIKIKNHDNPFYLSNIINNRLIDNKKYLI